MDEIRCAVELREVEGKPRLVGVLMPFNTEAADRRELFEPGSLSWPDPSGIVLNRQHSRAAPIMRIIPIESDGNLVVDSPLPDTSAGRDALAEIRSGLFKGLSVEFRAVRQSIVGGVRKISEAILTGAALCDSPAYSAATVEARARAASLESDRRTREFLL